MFLFVYFNIFLNNKMVKNIRNYNCYHVAKDLQQRVLVVSPKKQIWTSNCKNCVTRCAKANV